MLYAAFGAILGAALLSEEEYGYGESTLTRIPNRLRNQGGFGLRGEPRNWRDSDPRFGVSSQGMRGPTASFRYPMPRPWESAPVGWQNAVPAHTGRYGEMVFDEASIVSVDPNQYHHNHEKAAALFALFARDQTGRQILTSWSGPIRKSANNQVTVMLTGEPATELEQRFLRHLLTKYDLEMVRPRFHRSSWNPATRKTSPNLIEVIFDL